MGALQELVLMRTDQVAYLLYLTNLWKLINTQPLQSLKIHHGYYAVLVEPNRKMVFQLMREI